MKPLRLVLRGFKPFREEQTIDFTDLDFFLIRGPTGSGKTSILEAITYALYGKVKDLDKNDLINKNSARAVVDLTFSVKGKTYRVRREIYRDRSSAEVRFYEEGRLRFSKITEVNEFIQKLLGVKLEQFGQLFYLRQGAYDGFIKGTPKERKELLKGILELEIYEKLQKVFSEEFRETEGRLSQLEAELELYKNYTPEGLENLKKEIEEKKALREALKKKVEKVRQRLKELEEKLQKWEKLRRLKEELKKLREETLKPLSSKVSELKRFKPIEREIFQYLQLSEEREKLLRELERRKGELRKLKEEEGKLLGALKEAEKLLGKLEQRGEGLKEVERLVSFLEAKRDDWDKLGRKVAELKRGKEELQKLLSERERLEKALEKLREELKELEEKLASNEVKAEEEVELNEKLRSAKERKRLLLEREKLLKEKRELERRLKEKEAKLERLSERLKKKEKVLRELEGRRCLYLLAEGLKAGDICPVCGSKVERPPSEELPDTEKLKGLEAEVENLRGEVSKTEREIAVLKTKLENTGGKLSEVEEKLRELGELPPPEEVAKELEDLRKRKKEYEELTRKERGLREKLLKGEEKLKNLTERAESEEKRLGELKEEVENLKAELLAPLRKLANALKLPEEARKQLKGKELYDRLIALARKRLQKHGEELEKLTRSVQDLKLELQKVKTSKEHIGSEVENLGEKLRELEEKLKTLGGKIGNLVKPEREKLEEILKGLEKLESFLSELGNAQAYEKRLLSEIETLGEELGEGIPSEEEVEKLGEKLSELENRAEKLAEEVGLLTKTLEEFRRNLKLKGEKEKELSELRRKRNLLRTLRDDFSASRLQRFVLERALSELMEFADHYLRRLTDRYGFVLEGGEIFVYDALTDSTRSVKTLSGGETFLASLSVALGFGEFLGSSTSVESLFIDEGFGTLDKEKLGRVEEIFEVVRERVNKTVGIISHLEELAVLFDKRIEVIPSVAGSKIEVVK